MSRLFLNLDRLSNFHFTPKPATEELRVTSKTPSILLEETLPMAVSDAQLAAPQDVYESGDKGRPVGESERDRCGAAVLPAPAFATSTTPSPSPWCAYRDAQAREEEAAPQQEGSAKESAGCQGGGAEAEGQGEAVFRG